MKVFLSYASEDRALAELVAGSISARGHRVFFDRDDLPKGDTYEDRIEGAIAEAAVMVFLISPASVVTGRFTLTELGFARTRWRSAKGRVLPVMARPTPLDDVPAYLRTVSILEPEGNVPAEVAHAVQHMAWGRSRVARRAFITALSLSAISIGIYMLIPPSPAFETVARPPMAYEAGFFGEEESFNVSYLSRNVGAIADDVVEATLEVEPADALGVYNPRVGEPEVVAPGSAYEGYFKVFVRNSDARYRVCVHAKRVRKSCSAWEKWEASNDFLYGDKIPLDASLVENATLVGVIEEDYLVGAREPSRIVRLSSDGTRLAELRTEGEPISVSLGPLGLFVGTTGPNEVLELDPETLSIKKRLPVTHSPARNLWNQPISTQPASLAQDGTRLWVLTRGGASTAGIAWFDRDLSNLTTPPYYEEVASDLLDMRLRDGNDAVWSGRDSTTPASIVKFTPQKVMIYGGHDYEIASCASDVLPVKATELLVPDCKGWVHRVVAGETLDVHERVDSLLGYQSTSSSWERVRLDEAEAGKPVGVLSVRRSEPFEAPEHHEVRVSKLDWSTGAKLVFALDGARVVDSAAGPTAMLLILENADGKRQLVSPGYD